MAPFIALVGSFLVLRALGALGVPTFRDSRTALRWALAAMFLLTASAHFGGRRADLVRMVPPAVPAPELVVTLTGLAEIAGAIGLVIPRLAPWAGAGLALLLVAMFPANVHAAREGLTLGGAPVTPLVPRALLQFVFLGAVVVATALGPRRRDTGAGRATRGGRAWRTFPRCVSRAATRVARRRSRSCSGTGDAP